MNRLISDKSLRNNLVSKLGFISDTISSCIGDSHLSPTTYSDIYCLRDRIDNLMISVKESNLDRTHFMLNEVIFYRKYVASNIKYVNICNNVNECIDLLTKD